MSFLGLVLISMGWLFFLAGMVINWRSRKRGAGIPFLTGVVGSVTVFFTIPTLLRYGLDVPWPWLWILLPLVLDPYCLLGLLRLARK